MDGSPTLNDVKRYARELRSDKQYENQIERFDARSRMKVYGLNALTICSFGLFVLAGEPMWLVPVLIAVNGLFALPYLRVFIHSEAHWGLSKSRFGRTYMRYIAYSLYHVPFEAYRVGHFAHHQYDNDAPGEGERFSRDRQSTYLYSSQGIPVRFGAWAFHYLFVYQYANQIAMVAKRAGRRKLFEMGAQAAIIIGFDIAMMVVSWRFFVMIFVPSLVIAWLGSAIVLYMMHNVRLSDAKYHHSVNSYSKFFNSFGDNDGMHVVHSIVPFLHPYHQARVNELIENDLHPSQSLPGHYVGAFMKTRLFKQRSVATS